MSVARTETLVMGLEVVLPEGVEVAFMLALAPPETVPMEVGVAGLLAPALRLSRAEVEACTVAVVEVVR